MKKRVKERRERAMIFMNVEVVRNAAGDVMGWRFGGGDDEIVNMARFSWFGKSKERNQDLGFGFSSSSDSLLSLMILKKVFQRRK